MNLYSFWVHLLLFYDLGLFIVGEILSFGEWEYQLCLWYCFIDIVDFIIVFVIVTSSIVEYIRTCIATIGEDVSVVVIVVIVYWYVVPVCEYVCCITRIIVVGVGVSEYPWCVISA